MSNFLSNDNCVTTGGGGDDAGSDFAARLVFGFCGAFFFTGARDFVDFERGPDDFARVDFAAELFLLVRRDVGFWGEFFLATMCGL